MSPLKRLNEQVNDAAACKANGKGVVIGVTKGDNPAWLFSGKNGERFCDNSALHAAATHGANDFTIFIDSHCSTCATRARALDVDNASKSDALAGCAPTVNVVKKVTHD
jgi:uncharacterized protein YcnI